MGDVITRFSEVKNEEDPVPPVREGEREDKKSHIRSFFRGSGAMICGCARFVERRQSALYFALLVVGYILYLLVGAGIFSAIERPYEQELRGELKAARRDFLSNNSCVSDARLEELLARALEASNYGVTVLGNRSGRNWDFVSSLFFTSTVLTTTGYGHSVPLSDEGKGFCMFYALFGIPGTLFLLTALVQRIMALVTLRPLSYFHHRWALAKSKLAAIHAACLTLIMTLLLLIIPAWILVGLEKEWDFLESLYFCFISLTTIGLGDYVPGETQSGEDNPHPQLYRLAITVYLLLGLVFVLVLLETCYELPQMRRLTQRFYLEEVRELDSETTDIMDQDHLSDEHSDPSSHVTDHLPVIPSVSEQAASLRLHSGATPRREQDLLSRAN